MSRQRKPKLIADDVLTAITQHTTKPYFDRVSRLHITVRMKGAARSFCRDFMIETPPIDYLTYADGRCCAWLTHRRHIGALGLADDFAFAEGELLMMGRRALAHLLRHGPHLLR